MKPPLIPGARIIKALKRAGYRVTGQHGSHVKLFRDADESTLIIPLHNPVDRWTLKGILTDASISVENFVRLI